MLLVFKEVFKMKKLLVLLMVLGMVAVANAGIMDISIHEVGGGTYDGHALAASDELWLDIQSDLDGNPPAEYGYVALICDPLGTISGGRAVPTGENAGAGNLNMVFDPIDGYISYFPVPEGWGGIVGSISDSGGKTVTGVQIDQALFHCEGAGDVQVDLVWSADFVTFEVVDSVIIHQIPEPATIALLCLGGLLLRKK